MLTALFEYRVAWPLLAHCPEADTMTFSHAQVLASAQAGHLKYFLWEPVGEWGSMLALAKR